MDAASSDWPLCAKWIMSQNELITTPCKVDGISVGRDATKLKFPLPYAKLMIYQFGCMQQVRSDPCSRLNWKPQGDPHHSVTECLFRSASDRRAPPPWPGLRLVALLQTDMLVCSTLKVVPAVVFLELFENLTEEAFSETTGTLLGS